MAGLPASEIIPLLRELPKQDRQSLLCAVCALHDEIARNCQEHAHHVSDLLGSECPLYVDGIATCLLAVMAAPHCPAFKS